ncbi:DUF488 domain-containing protein [Adlercreutzia equolifaciens]|uniref:DUF488 domain-containing protein n=1 Tax=Adlercreutzia equolifaciens TaxID=446660 RepID=UPI003AF0BB50
MKIAIKRVYEPYEESDGYRVLVDRLWPRGLTKARVHYDEWAKFLAPSTKLRKAFGHDPAHWATFQEKYVAELNANPEALKFAKKLASPEMAKYPRVTLIYAARDEKENEAVVLQKWLPEHE